MSAQDLVITPIFLLFFYLVAWFLRARLTNSRTRKFFLPALTLKFLGAIALGFIYTFYYHGGDTMNYHRWGSRWIWVAFLDDPYLAFKIIFSNSKVMNPEIYEYTNHMLFYGHGGADFVSRLAGIFGLFCGNTYTTIALFFALISFGGSWWFYQSLSSIYPSLEKKFWMATFLLPSIVIWGAGLLKDSLVLGGVLMVFGSLIQIFELKRKLILNLVLGVLAILLILQVKIYVMLCLFPAILLYLFIKFQYVIKTLIIKIILIPLLLIVTIISAYIGIQTIPGDQSKYSIENISGTAISTANWHSYLSNRDKGAGYSLGKLDFSLSGLVSKSIPAINVTLFRPYIWEARSLFSLLSALESLFFLLFTISFVWKVKMSRLRKVLVRNPFILAALSFSITFAFSMGLVTNNFGALVRYKTPLLSLYLVALLITYYLTKKKTAH